MNWVKLAVDLAREAMSSAPPPPPRPEAQQSVDPGAALVQQFAAIDRNIDAIVSSVNAQNARLERELRRQRAWNYALLAGIVVAAVIALWR
jgi:hypothetical protein